MLRLDKPLFILFLSLAVFGILILASASSVLAEIYQEDPFYYTKRQLVWAAAGIIAFFIVVLIPYSWMSRLATAGLLAALFILILVFVPGIGRSVESSRDTFHRWIQIGDFGFQPSEFAKIALIIYTANLLSQKKSFADFEINEFFRSFALVGAVLGAIIFEPQYGTTITLIVLLAAMIYLAGFPLLRLAMIALSLVPLLIILMVLWEYRFERVQVWLDPYEYRYSGGYQLVTAFRAIGNGGIAGEPLASGFGHRYLTFGHTDFVLALFAEDYGIIGVVILSGLYVAVTWRAVHLLSKTENRFAYLTGSGALIMLGLQAVVNTFVVTGLIPTTGISLPFVSYGGSSLIVSYMLAGLLLSAVRNRSQEIS